MPWPWQRKKVPEPRTDSGRPIPQPAWDERGWVTYMMGDPVEFSSADNSGYVYAVQDKRYRPLDPGAVRVKDGVTGTVTAVGDDKLAVLVEEDVREIDPSLHPMKQKGLKTGPLIFSRSDLVNLKLEHERKWSSRRARRDDEWLLGLLYAEVRASRDGTGADSGPSTRRSSAQATRAGLGGRAPDDGRAHGPSSIGAPVGRRGKGSAHRERRARVGRFNTGRAFSSFVSGQGGRLVRRSGPAGPVPGGLRCDARGGFRRGASSRGRAPDPSRLATTRSRLRRALEALGGETRGVGGGGHEQWWLPGASKPVGVPHQTRIEGRELEGWLRGKYPAILVLWALYGEDESKLTPEERKALAGDWPDQGLSFDEPVEPEKPFDPYEVVTAVENHLLNTDFEGSREQVAEYAALDAEQRELVDQILELQGVPKEAQVTGSGGGDAMVSPEGKWHYVDSHPTWAHENWQRFGIERPQPWMSGDYEETDDPESAYFDANEQTALDAFMAAGWTRVKWPSGVETQGRNPVAARIMRQMSKDYPERDLYWDMGDKTEYYSGGRKIAGAIRMDPEVLKRAEDWIRTKLSQVALGRAQEALAAREEFADNLQQRKDLAETELDSARQDAADGDPVQVIIGLAEPGASAIVRVVPGDPESGEEWQVDWESKATGEITTVKYGGLSDLNDWLVGLAETQLGRLQKVDPVVQQEKVDLGRATVQALQDQAGGKTDTLPLGGMVDLGTINGVEVGPVAVTLIESSRPNGRFMAPREPGGKGYMELDVGRPPWSLKTVEERMPQLVEIFEHEAVHGFQQAARPEDDSYRPGMWSPGFDGVTDTVNTVMSEDHARADIEFYPRIVSEVHAFLRSGDTSNEAAQRWVENQQTFTVHRQPADALVAKFVAAVNNDMPPLADEFYASLPREEGSLAAPTWSGDDIVRWAEQRAAQEPAYQEAMDKWQKAVKVFFQEIDKARSRAAQRDDMIKWEKAGQVEEAAGSPVYDSYEDLVEALGREPEVLDVNDGSPGPEPGTIYYDDPDLDRTVLLTLYADIDPEELDNTEAVPVFDLYTYARDVAMAEAVTAPTIEGFVLMDDEDARERVLPLSPSLTAPEGGDEDDDVEWEDRQAQFNDTTDDEAVDDLDLVGDPLAQRLDQIQWEEGPDPVYEPAPPPPKKKDQPVYEEPFGTDPGANVEPPASDKPLPKLKPNSPQNIRAILEAASDHEIHYWASWYNQAHDASARIAEQTGQDFDRTVGVVAALSPNMKWAANLKAAEMLLQNPEFYRQAALNRVRGLAPINAAKAEALKPIADERRAAEKAAAAEIGQEKAALLAELAQPGVKVTQKAVKDGKFGPEAKKRLADIIRRTEAAKKAAAEPYKTKEAEIREQFQPQIDAVNQANPFTGVPQYTKNVLKALDVLANGPRVYSGVDPKTYQRIPGKAPPEANITGPKVSEFYNSIRTPEESKKEIVLDGHAINIYRGDPDAPLTEMRSMPKAERRKILRAYKQVAKEYGLLPQEVQAITWSIWREMKKQKNRPAKKPAPKKQESFNFEGRAIGWEEARAA